MNRPIYVIGHKNPDTDSIVSAIAYAEYKRQQGYDTIAARCGSVSSETEYLLDRFGFEYPEKIYSAKCLLKEIDKDKPSTCLKNLTMKKALDKTVKLKNRGLVVTDKKKHLEGIVTLGDLTNMWSMTDSELESLIRTIKIDNVVDIVEGTIVTRGEEKFSGKMHMFPSLKSNVDEDSIVLLRNENDKMQYCLDLGAKLLIITTSSPISKKIIKMAEAGDATIIVTELSPLYVSRLIYQTPTVEQVMIGKEKIDYFHDSDTVDDVTKIIAKSRRRSYPVVNSDEEVVGSVSRYHLFNYEKKKFIMVDHNEAKQMVDDIGEGEILEIIDHHRMGGFKTDNPINIITQTVGATATIIAKLYLENKMKLSKKMAGLLLGAMVSDTMNFKSPTTTDLDIEIAKKLEKLSGVVADELSEGMINAADSLLDKRSIQIVYDDFKEFSIEGNKVGIGQNICKSKEEFDKIKDELRNYMEDTAKTGGYDVMLLMLTRPNGTGSYVVSAGERRNILHDMFVGKIKDDFVEGLVSRKKQLLPSVIAELSK
ncbi:MAG: putative manganese-dependent inorganic diphosphatase [Erysipelotrichaceae bacterium]|nr:putative manganese-dependent inorganic diphosphatase [Erysipelotrichaceae bacterium]